MNRFEDSIDLFGLNNGSSTDHEIQCEMCKHVYNEGVSDDGPVCKNAHYGRISVKWTEFASLTVCECCFDKIELEIWLRRKTLIPWLKRILIKRKNEATELLNEFEVSENRQNTKLNKNNQNEGNIQK